MSSTTQRNDQLGEKRKRVGILGHVGTQNLGDEAIIASVIQNVRARYPEAEINCFTAHPDDTEARHHVRSFPIRQLTRAKSEPVATTSAQPTAAAPTTQESGLKGFIKKLPFVFSMFKGVQRFVNAVSQTVREVAFLVRAYRNLKGTDILLVAGSQQLNDAYGGPWGFPFTLFKWTSLAKLTGTKVAIMSVGAGPLDSPLSRFFCRRVLARADYRSYRDDISSQLAQRIGVSGKNPVVPDLVYSLRVQEARTTRGLRPVVGINPVPFFDERYWPTSDPLLYQDYVRKIADLTEWLSETGHQVVLFPTQLRADPPVIDDIQQVLKDRGKSGLAQTTPAFQGVEDLLGQLSKMDFVVANRYHGILLSIALNKPVLGLAYHDKSKALLKQIGVSELAVDSHNMELSHLKERFTLLESRADSIRKNMAENIGVLRSALNLQYDQVFALMGKDWAVSGLHQKGKANAFHSRPAQQDVGEVGANCR